MEQVIIQSIFIIAIIKTIQSVGTCPKQCTCSETRVDCSSQHFTTIPDNISESVVSLDLSNNAIQTVEDGQLAALGSLTTLSLQNNQLQTLTSAAFGNLTGLVRLYLGGNLISSINKILTDLPSLKDLDLNSNQLSDIAEMFNLPRLQRLNLNHNQITFLHDNTFNGIRNLYNLILSNNKISFISKSAFNGMGQLSSLVLSGNPIKNIDSIFTGVNSLSYLDATSCLLTGFPKDLPWTLRNLKLSQNNLTYVSNKDLSTQYLETLMLDNNQIQEIQDQSLSKKPYLSEINISFNKLKRLPQLDKNLKICIANNNQIQSLYQNDFAHDSEMQVLGLSKNQLQRLTPFTFSRLSNLTTLLLDLNYINSLTNMSFAGLRNVILLNLESNPIQKIEYRAFGGLNKLATLKLANIISNTSIEGIIFQDVPSLSSLDLQGSPSITQDVLNSTDLLHSLQNVQRLNLTNCSLQSLPMELRHSLPKLASLRLSDNPWKCDHEILELKKWISDSPEKFIGSKISCQRPQYLQGRLLQDVSFLELTQTPTALLTPTVDVAIDNITTETADIVTTKPEIYTTDLSFLYQEPTFHILESDTSESLYSQRLPHLKITYQGISDITTYGDSIQKQTTNHIILATTSFELTTPRLLASKTSVAPMSSSLFATNQILQRTSVNNPQQQISTSLDDKGQVHPASTVKMQSFSEIRQTIYRQDHTLSVTSSTSQLDNFPERRMMVQKLTDLQASGSTFDIPATDQQWEKMEQTLTLYSTSLVYDLTSHPAAAMTEDDSLSLAQTKSLNLIATKTLSCSHLGLHSCTSFQGNVKIEYDQHSTMIPEAFEVDSNSTNEVGFNKTTAPEFNITTNSSGSEKNSWNFPTFRKAEIHLPSIGRLADPKVKAAVIIVSGSLLILATGVVMAVVISRYNKRRKRLILDDDQVKLQADFQPETSETSAIITNMAGQHSTLDSGTSTLESKSTVSSNLQPPQQENSKYSWQHFKVTAIFSPSKFPCLRRNPEDDSEMLVFTS